MHSPFPVRRLTVRQAPVPTPVRRSRSFKVLTALHPSHPGAVESVKVSFLAPISVVHCRAIAPQTTIFLTNNNLMAICLSISLLHFAPPVSCLVWYMPPPYHTTYHTRPSFHPPSPLVLRSRGVLVPGAQARPRRRILLLPPHPSPTAPVRCAALGCARGPPPFPVCTVSGWCSAVWHPPHRESQ